MSKFSFLLWGAVGLLLIFSGSLYAVDSDNTTESFCHDWFGHSAHSSLLQLADTNVVVSAVVCEGETSGWIFRTDQVPPTCKGKRDQIAVLVGIGTDAKIKGVSVVSHREDARYFKRLKSSFFHQFLDRQADASEYRLDAVTRATLSSGAIIRDVMEGAKIVLAQPEVAAQRHLANKGG